MDKAAELKAEYDKAMETYNAENGEVFWILSLVPHWCLGFLVFLLKRLIGFCVVQEEGGSGKEADLELIDDE